MSAYQQVNLIDLKARLTERVGNNVTFFTAREKRYALNEAIRMWASFTGQWITKIQLPSTGVVFYDVPKQIVSLMRIRYNNTLLDQSSLFELDNSISNWQQAPTGTPTLWSTVGLDKFALYPPAPVGANLRLEGIAVSPRLGSGGDFIDIGDEELTRILEYAQHYLSMKEAGLEFANTRPLLANFVVAAAARNSRLRAAGPFAKYLGLQRDEEERPDRSARSVGARG